MRFYLAPWVRVADETGGYWSQPAAEDCVGSIDLRPRDGQAALGGAPIGVGFFGYETSIDPARIPGAIDLGPGLDAPIRNRSEAGAALGLQLGPGTVLDSLWDVLTTRSDPSAAVRAKPLTVNSRRRMLLRFGGRTLRGEVFRPGRTSHEAKLLEVHRADYRRARVEARTYAAGDSRSETHLRFLAELAALHRLDYRQFIPSDLPDEGTRDPSTSFADDFNRANSGDPNALDTGKLKNGSAGTWQWNEVANGCTILTNVIRADTQSTAAYCRVDDDHSSANQTVSADVASATVDSSFKQLGPCARFSASANDSYMAMRQVRTGTDQNYLLLRKTVAGSRSNLTPSAVTIAFSAGEKITTVVDGSDVTGYHDDVEKITDTDTTITGNLRAGFFIFAGNGVHKIELDNYSADDVAVAATSAPPPPRNLAHLRRR